jgi:hypothetical protein
MRPTRRIVSSFRPDAMLGKKERRVALRFWKPIDRKSRSSSSLMLEKPS